MTGEELGTDFPTNQDLNIDGIPLHNESEKELFSRNERLHREEKNLNYHSGIDVGFDHHDLPYARNSTHQKSGTNEDSYIDMDWIIKYKANYNQNYKTAEIRESLHWRGWSNNHHQLKDGNWYIMCPSRHPWNTSTGGIYRTPRTFPMRF